MLRWLQLLGLAYLHAEGRDIKVGEGPEDKRVGG